ncbi:hypothetical protein GGR53DRAFT_462477 [Hypoxylon sp. FL1150]|nr:hypothetical protein GGR53DRAFT_462477 [Hypoxylon sp. FL1150]
MAQQSQSGQQVADAEVLRQREDAFLKDLTETLNFDLTQVRVPRGKEFIAVYEVICKNHPLRHVSTKRDLLVGVHDLFLRACQARACQARVEHALDLWLLMWAQGPWSSRRAYYMSTSLKTTVEFLYGGLINALRDGFECPNNGDLTPLTVSVFELIARWASGEDDGQRFVVNIRLEQRGNEASRKRKRLSTDLAEEEDDDLAEDECGPHLKQDLQAAVASRDERIARGKKGTSGELGAPILNGPEE